MAIPWLIGGAIAAAAAYIVTSDSSSSSGSSRSREDYIRELEEEREEKLDAEKRQMLERRIEADIDHLVEKYAINESARPILNELFSRNSSKIYEDSLSIEMIEELLAHDKNFQATQEELDELILAVQELKEAVISLEAMNEQFR